MAVNSFNAQNPPVTTKGDLFTFSTIPTRLGVGANNTVLTADSSTATGLKWATASSGGMTLLESGTLSGASVTTGTLSSSYQSLYVVIRNPRATLDASYLRVRFNGDTNNRYSGYLTNTSGTSQPFDVSSMQLSPAFDNTVSSGIIILTIPDYANTSTWKIVDSLSVVTNQTTTANSNYARCIGQYNQTGAISTITFFEDAGGNWAAGNYYVYGVK